MKPDQERIRSLLVDTISLLCRNGLNFENELRVQAVVGVTVDKEECFLIHINKCFERKTLDEENCENEEELSKSLQEIVATSNEPEIQSTAALQPTRCAPPTPSEEAIKKLSGSQDMSPSSHEQNNCQQQQQVSGNNASKSDMQMAKPSKHESFDECEEFIASLQRMKMMNRPAAVDDSDDCDDMTDMQHQRYYDSSQPTRNKHQRSFDAYRPKTKRQNLCDDLFDAEDDYCSDFNVGQQYMYIDSGRSRARPKVSKQQHHDVPFSPRCTPSMLPYGTQDVRLLVLNSCYDCYVLDMHHTVQ